MSELSADGVGTTTQAEDTTMEKVSTRSRAKAKAKGKAKENATTAERPDTMQGTVPIRKRAKAKARVSKENVTTAEKKDTLQENAPKEKVTKAKEKEKEKVTRAKVKEPGVGVKVVCGQWTEKGQEIGTGHSRRKRSRRGASDQLRRPRRRSTSMRRGMKKFADRGKGQ
jgi:hypothetical protein